MSDVFVVGMGCFLGAASLTLFYYAERAKKEARFVASATRLSLCELARLFDDENQGRVVQPVIVAVSGRVASSKPLACKLSGLKGVLVEEKVELVFKRKNDGDGSWIRDSALMRSTSTKEVSWYLDDGSGPAVYIRGARGAHGFSFPVEKEAFHKYPPTCGDHKFIKMLGVKRTVSLLPTGTSLTVVGKAVKDDCGRIWIQPPPNHDGSFYVFRMTIDELVAYVGQNGRLLREVAQLLMVSVGLVLVLGCITAERKHQETRFAVEIKHPETTILHQETRFTVEIKHPESTNLYAGPSNPNLYAVPSNPNLYAVPSNPNLYAVPKPQFRTMSD